MRTLLIIEDLPDVAKWLSKIAMECLGIEEIAYANDLASAKDIISTKQFSFALIDIGLPDGSGLDALKLIKLKNTQCLCVITTVFDDSETLFMALKQGADGYILKSEGSAELSNHLRGILKGKPPLSAAIAKKVLSAFTPSKLEVKLSPREEQVLTFISKGYNIPATAKLLDISAHTASDYLKQAYKKLQVNNRADATLKAHELGLVSHSRPSHRD